MPSASYTLCRTPRMLPAYLGTRISVASNGINLDNLAPYLARELHNFGLQTARLDTEIDGMKRGLIKRYGNDTIYIIYYAAGIALRFTKLSGSTSTDLFELDSLELYNADERYAPASESILPFNGLTNSTTAQQFIQAYGEPTAKGGGFSQSFDIWLRWDPFDSISTIIRNDSSGPDMTNTTTSTRQTGLEIQIDNRSWDSASNSKWKSLTLYLAS
ncbi:hypothetical protein V1508DRAFT_438536 [Lipomyces doorenjongii]|uniref:uncharacterized protein n=1 Tax=Lipomyces doorenjongii TaxID=383834 RepID=UPI0034CFAE87